MKGAIATALVGATLAMGGGVAHAQSSPRSPLLDLPVPDMRDQVESRYEAAVQATLSPEIKRSEDSRFIWASEAKVQCGIALGYLKTRTVDADSVNKCDGFSARMTQAYVAPPPEPPPVDESCSVPPTVSIFFDWNVDAVRPEAQTTVQQLAASRASCNWSGYSLVGHADRSGSDAYNADLSLRRARNVATVLEAAGIPGGDLRIDGRGETELKVETADGVREPQNRRVEITAIAPGQ